MNAAKSRKIEVVEPRAFKTIPGYGISATVGKTRVLVGNAALMKREKVEIEDKVATAMAELEEKGETVVIVAENRKITGLIAIADTIKEHSRETIEKLNKMGYKTVLITGDNERTALAIAKQVGIKRVMAHVFPEDKANEVKRLQKEGNKVAFVGDGIIVLIKSDLRDIITAIQISKYTVEKIKQNLFWAFFYNAVGIPIAMGILYPITGFLLNPVIAGAAMAFSSVSVVSNSLLMRSFKPRR